MTSFPFMSTLRLKLISIACNKRIKLYIDALNGVVIVWVTMLKSTWCQNAP